MVANVAPLDYYAVLQVHPDADSEVIDAAYRQLMKKYHPDRAGTDPRLIVAHHQRSVAINESYAVLRDPARRRRYDEAARLFVVPRTAPPRSQREPAPSVQPTPPSAPPPHYSEVQLEEPAPSSALSSLLAALSAPYFLLPGPYEWEPGHRQEVLTAFLIPPLGVTAFALATGRLPWIGHSTSATLVAWAILLVLSLPAWRFLPRVALAGAPSLVLLTGNLDGPLRQANLPAWLAWAALALLSMALSARLYIFSVLPTLGVCWLMTRLGG